ncbi:MAG: phage major capsid protein [Gammaproteobacteria bacterium]
MASPNSAFTDIVTTSLQGYSGTLADNVTNHNALLADINERGNKQTATGRTIVQELEYAENSTAKWYSGFETLSTAQSEVFSAAEYSYKQLAGNVVISGLEEIQNSGKEAVHNLVRSRIRNLEKTLRNNVATALYADGTGTSGKEMGGLQLNVADNPANTVGGIDASTFSFWQNKEYDASDESVTLSATTIQEAMNTLWLRTIRGADRTTTITADTNYFKFYWSSLQSNQRFTSERRAAAGFMNLMFMSAPVFYDDQCPTNRMYFLNTDYLFLRPARGREFIPLGDKASINQDAMVMPVVWAGNMTCSNRSLQGVMQP